MKCDYEVRFWERWDIIYCYIRRIAGKKKPSNIKKNSNIKHRYQGMSFRSFQSIFIFSYLTTIYTFRAPLQIIKNDCVLAYVRLPSLWR